MFSFRVFLDGFRWKKANRLRKHDPSVNLFCFRTPVSRVVVVEAGSVPPDVSAHPMPSDAIRTGVGLPRRMVIQDASAEAGSARTVSPGRECASDAVRCDRARFRTAGATFPFLATTVAYSVTRSVYNGLTYVNPS